MERNAEDVWSHTLRAVWFWVASNPLKIYTEFNIQCQTGGKSGRRLSTNWTSTCNSQNVRTTLLSALIRFDYVFSATHNTRTYAKNDAEVLRYSWCREQSEKFLLLEGCSILLLNYVNTNAYEQGTYNGITRTWVRNNALVVPPGSKWGCGVLLRNFGTSNARR